jgi:hypothetical protein
MTRRMYFDGDRLRFSAKNQGSDFDELERDSEDSGTC